MKLNIPQKQKFVLFIKREYTKSTVFEKELCLNWIFGIQFRIFLRYRRIVYGVLIRFIC